MIEFTIIPEPDQQFAAILNQHRVTLRFRYNTWVDRWFFDLSRDDLPIIQGRRVVAGVNLLQPFAFELGAIFAVGDDPPGFEALTTGKVKLYHATEEEIGI